MSPPRKTCIGEGLVVALGGPIRGRMGWQGKESGVREVLELIEGAGLARGCGPEKCFRKTIDTTWHGPIFGVNILFVKE